MAPPGLSPRAKVVDVEIFGILALLACPVGMGAMMWFMSRGMGGRRDSKSPSASELRTERSALDDEIARLERAERRDVVKSPS